MLSERLLTGWNLPRMVYLVLGLLIIFQSVQEEQWLGLLLGGYICAMGLFAFGCAGGACGIQDRNPKK